MAGRLPLIAVVRRPKDASWVLPKGKIKSKENAFAVARREVAEEIGRSVVVKEFLGIISYKPNGKPKIVHFWLMASGGNREPKPRAVKWLPLGVHRAS